MKFKMLLTITKVIESDTLSYGDKEVTPEEAVEMEQDGDILLLLESGENPIVSTIELLK